MHGGVGGGGREANPYPDAAFRRMMFSICGTSSVCATFTVITGNDLPGVGG